MGTSPAIEEQATKDQAVYRYLSEICAALTTASSSARAEMDQQIRQFYNTGGWNDAKLLVSGSFQHVATASTWSLDPVEAMIDAMCRAVFGVTPPSTTIPAGNSRVPTVATGATLAGTDEVTKGLLAGMRPFEKNVANGALQVIIEILSAFKASRSGGATETMKGVANRELIPGLSVFVTVVEMSSHSKGFFNDEMLVHDVYLFECRVSATQAVALAQFERIKSLVGQQSELLKTAKDLGARVAALRLADYKARYGDEAVKYYKADMTALSGMLTAVNTQIEAIGKLIEGLRN